MSRRLMLVAVAIASLAACTPQSPPAGVSPTTSAEHAMSQFSDIATANEAVAASFKVDPLVVKKCNEATPISLCKKGVIGTGADYLAPKAKEHDQIVGQYLALALIYADVVLPKIYGGEALDDLDSHTAEVCLAGYSLKRVMANAQSRAELYLTEAGKYLGRYEDGVPYPDVETLRQGMTIQDRRDCFIG